MDNKETVLSIVSVWEESNPRRIDSHTPRAEQASMYPALSQVNYFSYLVSRSGS
jgi:hypothetical protein